MTEHTFDLAAALVDTAAERLATTPYGTSHIGLHNFGHIALCAEHTIADTGHTARVTASDDHRLLAAAEARATHADHTPSGRIVLFRAGHLTFTALQPASATDTTFIARGTQLYLLTATAGTDQWRVSVGDGTPQKFNDINTALDHILNEREPAHSA